MNVIHYIRKNIFISALQVPKQTYFSNLQQLITKECLIIFLVYHVNVV